MCGDLIQLPMGEQPWTLKKYKSMHPNVPTVYIW
jgi:hypothetical protein